MVSRIGRLPERKENLTKRTRTGVGTASRSHVYAGSMPFIFLTFSAWPLTVSPTMTTMLAMTDKVHRDEGEEDQNKEPVRRLPFDIRSP